MVRKNKKVEIDIKVAGDTDGLRLSPKSSEESLLKSSSKSLIDKSDFSFSDYLKKELLNNGWFWDISNKQYYTENGHIIDLDTIINQSWFILYGLEYVYIYFLGNYNNLQEGVRNKDGSLTYNKFSILPDYFSLNSDGSFTANYTINLLTVEEAAKELGVSGKTIREWDNNGKLKTTRTIGGHRRINKEEIDNIKKLRTYCNDDYVVNRYSSIKSQLLDLMNSIKDDVNRMINLIEEDNIQPINNYLKLINNEKLDCAISNLVYHRNSINSLLK